mmetsp:Transcript_24237/g.75716  ORF Transcript_24237/g.75716 Transcript_24237/m.75716 type:complete len:242 (-) Transcript_24237:41-766(-)
MVPRAPQAVPGRVPRHAGRGRRVRAVRPRPREGALHRIRRRDRVAHRHLHARGRRREGRDGRHDAPREPRHGPPRGRVDRARRGVFSVVSLRRRSSGAGAAPAPLRGEPRGRARLGEGGPPLRRQGRLRGTHGDRRAAAVGAPVLHGLPVPPRVQVAAHEGVAAVLRLRARGRGQVPGRAHEARVVRRRGQGERRARRHRAEEGAPEGLRALRPPSAPRPQTAGPRAPLMKTTRTPRSRIV